MNKKLYRDEYHKVLGGVCSGLAEYFEMDVTVVRLLFAFTVIFMGVGIIPYIVLWIVLPRKDYTFNNYNNPTVDYTVPPPPTGDPSDPTQPQPANPFANPYSNNPFGNNPYSGPAFGDPAGNIAPKPKSHAGIIVGVVLIVLGAAILIDEYDIIPDFDFDKLWPAVLVIVGGALIISGQKRQPWHNTNWQSADKKEEPVIDNPPAADSPPETNNPPATDNPSTIEPQ